MSSIVTQNFKKELMASTIRTINSTSENFYIGIGKSDPWPNNDSAEIALDNVKIQNEFRNSLQAIHRIIASRLVVPRYEWKKNRYYQQYDDVKDIYDYGSEPFYVINNNNGVYICLRQAKDDHGTPLVSTIMPTNANNDPVELADGYVWKFLYTISTLDAALFMSDGYMPVTRQDMIDSNSTGIELKQWEIQQTAKSGMITSFDVVSGGGGYTNPKIQINDVSYTDLVDFWMDSLGSIMKVEYQPDSTGTTLNYLWGLQGARVQINDSNGANATVRAILSPAMGIGADATSDLKCGSMMFSVRIDGDAEDFLVEQDFRQVGVIRGMKDSISGSQFTDLTGRALYSMNLDSETVPFTTDEIIIGDISGARAFVDQADSSSIYYHQTEFTGWKPFIDGELVTELANFGSGRIGTARIPPEVSPYTGEILYIDNRAPITRVPEQTEDIKIVIRLDECQ
jgi:hypothetical protein